MNSLEAVLALQEINSIVDELSPASQQLIHSATKGIADILEILPQELRGVVIGIVGLCAEIGAGDATVTQ